MDDQTGRTKSARVALGLTLGVIYATLGSVRTVSNALRDAGYLRLTVVIIFVTVGLVATILLSRIPAMRTWRAAVGLLVVAAAYGAVTFAMDSPEEKLHFIEYGAVALLAFASAPNGWSTPGQYGFAALFTAAAGWIDEGIQALLPTRYYDLRDVGFNAAAGLMALTALAAFRWLLARRAA